MHAWHARHKREECAARRSRPTGTSRSALVGLDGRNGDAELKAKLAHARAFKPIPIDSDAPRRSQASNGWHRADIDPWGRREGGPAKWVGGNDSCLRSTIAYLLNAPDINAVPDNSDLVGNENWFAVYNERLARIGARLAEVSVDRAFASLKPWVANIVDDDAQLHAIVCCGNRVQFDPADNIKGWLPRDRVRYGLTIAKA
jgi:hypothetical protein